MQRVDEQLIEAARSVCRVFPLSADFSSGSVGAALRTESGNVHIGVCIDLACGLGFCAEAAAIAEMLKHRESRIETIVALDTEGQILAPCGRCREMIAQVNPRNLDTWVLLKEGRVARLRDLLPEYWNPGALG